MGPVVIPARGSAGGPGGFSDMVNAAMYGVDSRRVYLGDSEGAVFDEVTDDTAAIQAVLDRMVATDGGLLLLPGLAGISGDTVGGIRHGLRLPCDDITIMGLAPGAGFKAITSDPQILLRDYDETVRERISAINLSFLNNTVFDVNGCRGIRLYKFQDFTVEGCYFENCLVMGVEGGIPYDYESKNLSVRHCRFAGAGGKVPFSGVAVFFAEGVEVDFNRFQAIARPFDLEVGSASATIGVLDFSFCHNRVLAGTLSTESSTNSYGGAHLTTQNGGYIKDGDISHNRFRSGAHTGTSLGGGDIYMASSSGEITAVTVAHNKSRDFSLSAGNAAQAAIYLVGQGVQDCEIVENILKNSSGTGSPRGIRLTDAKTTTVARNRIAGSWTNSYQEDATVRLNNNWLENLTSISPSMSDLATSHSNHVRTLIQASNEYRIVSDAAVLGPAGTVVA